MALPNNRRSPPNDLRPPLTPLAGVYPAVNMMLPGVYLKKKPFFDKMFIIYNFFLFYFSINSSTSNAATTSKSEL